MTDAAIPTARPEVLLIDLSSLYWASYHATKDASVSEAASLTATAIRRCIGDSGALVAICCDKGRSFRKDIAPTYKANRPEKDQAALAELARLKEKLVADGFLLWGVDGFEADDVIATAAHAASKAGHPIRIASADKDLLQLLALPDSSCLRTHNWNTVRAADVVTKFGIEPEGLLDWLSLTGDSSDGIKGCPGVGEKRATELLLAHYDIDTLYAKIDEIPGGATMTPEARKIATPAILQALKDNKAQVMTARELIRLRFDVPIKFDEIYERREPVTTTREIDMSDDDVPFDQHTNPVDAKFEDARISGAPQVIPLDTAKYQPAAVPTQEEIAGVRAQQQDMRPKEEPKPEPPKEPPSPSDPVSSAEGHSKNAAAPTSGSSTEPRALVVAETVPFRLALEPTNLSVTFKLANALYESRLYTKFPTAQAIAAVIMRGREMGLGALASLDAFFVVEGRPYAYAYLIIAQAKSDPDCLYFQLIESSDESATWETQNRQNPKPTRYTYTIAEAIKAGLAKKDLSNWNTRPREMLTKSAGSKLARIEYPSAALGLVAIEEIGGEP